MKPIAAYRQIIYGSVMALLLTLSAGVVQAESEWAKFGRILGQGNASEDAYLQGYLEGLERETQLQEARHLNFLEAIRSRLVSLWKASGLSASEANALAASYELTASGNAVLDGVRRKGANTAIEGIRSALDNYNYLLANQLLLAYVIVSNEEKKAAAQQDDERSPANLEESPPTGTGNQHGPP